MDKLTSRSFRKKRKKRTNRITMKRIFDFLGNLIIILLIVLVGFSIYGNIQTNGKGYRVPSIGSYMWMSVLSNSMKPVFSAGDLIVDKKVDAKDLKAGDIVTFVWGSSLSTHRITEVIKDDKGNISYKTKGDNNNIGDFDVTSSNKIVGKYMFSIPFAGFILTSLRGLAGVVLIWIMFISIIGAEVYKKIKSSRINKINKTITQ